MKKNEDPGSPVLLKTASTVDKGSAVSLTVDIRPLLIGGPIGDETVVGGGGGGIVRRSVVVMPVAREEGGRVGDEVVEVRHLDRSLGLVSI